jgi:hypothetical protein
VTFGETFARTLAAKDAVALKALLRPDLEFRGMTPGRFWEADTADGVVDDILLGQWFKPQDRITEVLGIETGELGVRQRVGYRFSVASSGQSYLVEQQAYFEETNGQIGWLRIMCAGFQPTMEVGPDEEVTA